MKIFQEEEALYYCSPVAAVATRGTNSSTTIVVCTAVRTCPQPIIVIRRYRLCRTTVAVGVGEGGEGVEEGEEGVEEGEAAVGAAAEAEAWVGMHSEVQTRAWG